MSIVTRLKEYRPAFMGAPQQKFFDRARARAWNEAQRMLDLELAHCQALLKSPKKLESVESLLALKRRMLFLAEETGERRPDEKVFALLHREAALRRGFYWLNVLRSYRDDKTRSFAFRAPLAKLKKAMREANATPRKLGTTKNELDSFKPPPKQ